ncbi:MAG: outer membrane lipoprotein-sorting protein [Acidobacteriota bacterium]
MFEKRNLLKLFIILFFSGRLMAQELNHVLLKYNSNIQRLSQYFKDLTVTQKITLDTEGMTFEEVSIIYYKVNKKAKKTLEFKRKKMPEKIPELDFFTGFPISEKDYKISIIGKDNIDGEECFKISLVPRRKDKTLINGFIWVSFNDYVLIKFESSPLDKPTMVKELHITQIYSKNPDGIWLPSKRILNSIANAIIKDIKSITTFEYYDYKINSGIKDEIFK